MSTNSVHHSVQFHLFGKVRRFLSVWKKVTCIFGSYSLLDVVSVRVI